MKEKSIYLPGINGLRSIAALSVLISHVSLKGVADFGLPYLIQLPLAGYGVTLFFVISGFLITYLLLQELKSKSTIDVKYFYIRRILRIWPIYYLFIIVCLVSFFVFGENRDLIHSDLLYYVFFSANIPFVLQTGIGILAHYWSIGVEEQFYLLWPWVVKHSKDKLLILFITLFVILFLIKLLIWFYLGSKSIEYRMLNVTRFHCMIIGAIGSLLYLKKDTVFIKIFSSKFFQLFSWIIFVSMGIGVFYLPSVISNEFIAIISLCLIISQIELNNRIINLENIFFDFIGKISYGIYVIHPLIIMILSRLIKPFNINLGIKYIIVYITVVGVTIFFSWLSFHYFEVYFLKLKLKFTVIKSSNTMELL